LAVSEGVARDKTEDWLLAEAARPRSFAELEAKIEYAVAVARSAENAVAEIGAAALDAAEGARRAAEVAEGCAAQLGAAPAGPVANAAAGPGAVPAAAPDFADASAASPGPDPVHAGARPARATVVPVEDERLRHFRLRADRLSARLERLQHC
jgi:hypothetical protein